MRAIMCWRRGGSGTSHWDAFFYDVACITAEEAGTVGPLLALEGAILIVPPGGGAPLTLCTTFDAFRAARPASLRAMVVAGVGSSALGCAAFARNVANALDEPVAGVVSGYGLSDLVAEALGGFYLFGTLNRLRHGAELWDRLTESMPRPRLDGGSFADYARQSYDTQTVAQLLTEPECGIEVAVGHSKGNLVISEALFAIEEEAPERSAALRQSLRVATISAKVAMPRGYGVYDVIGQLDGFGALNSRPDIPAERVVPGAWHHTSGRWFPLFPLPHIDVGDEITRWKALW